MTDSDKSGHRERLRRRFLAGEAPSRSEEAVLELLLTYAIPQKDVQPLAKRLIARFGRLSGVLAASPDALTQVDGIKTATAVLLKVADWLRSRVPLDSTESKVAEEAQGQRTLFGVLPKGPAPQGKRPEKPSRVVGKPATPARSEGIFGKAILREAISLLPDLPDTESVDEVREHLQKKLHFSAQETRHRYANYIVRRMFPTGVADRPLRVFAKRFGGTQFLRDVCFYRFMKVESLTERAVVDLLLPNVGSGRLARGAIREYLLAKFPGSKSIKDCAQAIAEALDAAGLANSGRGTITFGYRDIPLPAFAFILHSEFPEPGMYEIPRLAENTAVRAMLWNPDRLLPALYELRNRGLISKVSEIDNIRQFTTRWALGEMVERLVREEKPA